MILKKVFFSNWLTFSFFTFAAPKSFHIPEELKCQYFKFSPNVLNSQLTKAHLWVYLSPTNQMQETTAWINIYQVVKQENGFDSPTLLHVIKKFISQTIIITL